MRSRMDRYYTNDNSIEKSPEGRTTRNQELYKNKDYNIYSSNETIIDTSNEVDITKIKDIIKSREDYQRAKSYRTMLNDKSFDYDDIPKEEDDFEEKDYDINTLLQKVKENKSTKKDEEEKVRKLRNTQYDILSKLDVRSKASDTESQKEELKDLINTITHKEDETSLDLLEELKGEDTTVLKGAEELSKEITKAMMKQAQIESPTAERKAAEKDFYSDSFTFSKKDFEGLKDDDYDEKSGSILMKILIFILIVVIITIGLFIADSFFDFIPYI